MVVIFSVSKLLCKITTKKGIKQINNYYQCIKIIYYLRMYLDFVYPEKCPFVLYFQGS
jgi:hypothetical protein